MHKSPTYSKIVSCSKICKRNKQDFQFNFLLQIQIVKSYNFRLKSACGYEFQTLPHPTIFLTACIRSKESISIPAVMQKNLVPISTFSFHWLHQKKKDEILSSPCISHPWIKPLTSHLVTSPPSHLFQLVTSLPSHLSNFATSLSSHPSHLPTSLPSHLYHLPSSLPSHLSQHTTFPTTSR